MRFVVWLAILCACVGAGDAARFRSLRILDVSRSFMSSTSPSRLAGTHHPCYRKCKKGESMVCKYNFTVSQYTSMSLACGDCPRRVADCFRQGCVPGGGHVRPVTVANLMLPGPSIQVCRGDYVEIDVDNVITSKGISIHWHGMWQLGTPFMDGTPYLTQCPIQPHNSFKYEWFANPGGTNFWHSHVGFEEADGLFGSLIVRVPDDPLEKYYDYDLPEHVVIVWHWYASPTGDLLRRALHQNYTQDAYSLMINGLTAQHTIERNGTRYLMPRAVFHVEQGKRFRFRTIFNSAVYCPVQVSIDNHKLLMIASDTEGFEPVEVDSFMFNAGERYDFVLNANQKPGNYWIRFKGFGLCNRAAINVSETAILRYTNTRAKLPLGSTRYEDAGRKGVILNPAEIPTMNYTGDTLIKLVNLTYIEETPKRIADKPDHIIYLVSDMNVYEEILSSGPYPQYNNLSFELPPITLLTQYDEITPDMICTPEDQSAKECTGRYCTCPMIYSVGKDSLVEVVFIDVTTNVSVNHPMHFHGHAFYVVAEESIGRNISADDIKRRNEAGQIPKRFKGAPGKDTIMVQAQGYSIIRFIANNPGYWFLHCHITEHVELGMAAVIKVGEHSQMVQPPKNFPKCGGWNLPKSEKDHFKRRAQALMENASDKPREKRHDKPAENNQGRPHGGSEEKPEGNQHRKHHEEPEGHPKQEHHKQPHQEHHEKPKKKPEKHHEQPHQEHHETLKKKPEEHHEQPHQDHRETPKKKPEEHQEQPHHEHHETPKKKPEEHHEQPHQEHHETPKKKPEEHHEQPHQEHHETPKKKPEEHHEQPHQDHRETPKKKPEEHHEQPHHEHHETPKKKPEEHHEQPHQEHHETPKKKPEEHHAQPHKEHHETPKKKPEEHNAQPHEEHHETPKKKPEEHHEQPHEEHHETPKKKPEEHHEQPHEEHHETPKKKPAEHHAQPHEEHHEAPKKKPEEHHAQPHEQHHEASKKKPEEHHEQPHEEHHEAPKKKPEENHAQPHEQHHEAPKKKPEEHHEQPHEEHHETPKKKPEEHHAQPHEEHHETPKKKPEEHHEQPHKEHHETPKKKPEEHHEQPHEEHHEAPKKKPEEHHAQPHEQHHEAPKKKPEEHHAQPHEEHHETPKKKPEEHHEQPHQEHHETPKKKPEEHHDQPHEEHHETPKKKPEEHHEQPHQEHHETPKKKPEEHHEQPHEEHHEAPQKKPEEHHEQPHQEHHEAPKKKPEEHHEQPHQEHHETPKKKPEEHHEQPHEEHHETPKKKPEEHHEQPHEEHHEEPEKIPQEHHHGEPGGSKIVARSVARAVAH